MNYTNLTNLEFDFVNSKSCDHLTFDEKHSLLKKYSSLKSWQKTYGHVEFYDNDNNYHKMLMLNSLDNVLVVGGEGKSTFNNIKTLNLIPNSNAEIIADIDKTILPNNYFDVIFFERIGFSRSFYTIHDGSNTIDVTINSLMESYRLLKHGGRIVIITGRDSHNSINYLLSVSKMWKRNFDMQIESNLFYEDVLSKHSYTPLHFTKI